MMMQNILLVALGGALGSVGRYLVGRVVTTDYPWSTLLVNIVGSLLIGVLMGLVNRHILSPEMKLLFVTGFCGGFTTFSTLSHDALGMLRTGDVLAAALYVGLSVALGILAAWLGMQMVRGNV